MVFVPSFVTELTDAPGHVTDCVPSSGLMLVNKVTHNRYPASVAEREALQNAMGTQDAPANLAQLAAGVKKRYGLTLTPVVGWAALAAVLANSLRGAVIVGNYQSLPAGLRNQANQPTFNGGHGMYAQGVGGGNILIGDPLGWHYDAATPISSIKAFADSYGDQYVAAAEQTGTLVGYRASVGPGTVIFWRVMRFTHALYGALRTTWAHGSGCEVKHGSPGFWGVQGGYYAGRYLVAGRSGPFTVRAIYSNGSSRPVDVHS